MVKLTDKYSLEADRYNYILVEHGTNKKTGEVTEKHIAFVQNLPHAVEVVYKIESRRYIKAHDVELKEALKAFREIWDDVQAWGSEQK